MESNLTESVSYKPIKVILNISSDALSLTCSSIFHTVMIVLSVVVISGQEYYQKPCYKFNIHKFTNRVKVRNNLKAGH